MLCHVLGRHRHALQRPRHAYATSLADLGMLLQGLRSPTSKRNTLTTPLTSQLIRQQVGGFLFNVGLLGPCKSMPRSVKDDAKHAEIAEDIDKYT